MLECVVDGCDALAKAPRGWCWKHYQRWRKYGDPLGGWVKAECSVGGCGRVSRSAGMCEMHYSRMRRHGDPTIRLLMPRGVCTHEGCTSKTFGKGLCQKHYYVMWVDGGGRQLKAAAIARRRALASGVREVDGALSWVALWESDSRECHICGVTCDPDDCMEIINRAGRAQKICGPRYPSLDHVIPLSAGGSHTRENTALACLDCNRRKWANTSAEQERRQGGSPVAATEG